jgi:hypothetical protein
LIEAIPTGARPVTASIQSISTESALTLSGVEFPRYALLAARNGEVEEEHDVAWPAAAE